MRKVIINKVLAIARNNLDNQEAIIIVIKALDNNRLKAGSL
jgi:hypothetical protein